MKRLIASVLFALLACQIHADISALRVSLFPDDNKYMMVEFFSLNYHSLGSSKLTDSIQLLPKYRHNGGIKVGNETVKYECHLFLIKEGEFEQKYFTKTNDSQIVNHEIIFKGTIKLSEDNHIELHYAYENRTTDTSKKPPVISVHTISSSMQTKLDQTVAIGGILKTYGPSAKLAGIPLLDDQKSKAAQRESSAHPNPIFNGQIILVKKDGKYGAFQFTEQKTDPECASFDWWYNNDGTNIINKENKGVVSGQGKTVLENEVAHYVQFGPFKVLWSRSTNASGWIYYPLSRDHLKNIEKLNVSNFTSICVTDLFDAAGINAADPKWTYKISRDSN